MPLENVGIEHVPVVAIQNLGADLGLGLDQPFRGQGLQGFAQRRARHPEQLHQLRIARQGAADGEAALHDVLADPMGDEIMGRSRSRGPLKTVTQTSCSCPYLTGFEAMQPPAPAAGR